MAIQRISNSMLFGLAADTKPTTFANNTLYFEQDTGNVYRWNAGGTTWDLYIGATKTETLTNKTIAAGSNTITGIVDANIGSHTSTKITITAKGQLNGAIVYNDAANVFGDFDQSFRSTRLRLANPANTFFYTFTTSAISANRAITVPLLTADDQVTLDGFATTLTNKTLSAASNTITDASTALGDLFVSNGTKFVKRSKGTGLQVLRTNSGATDIEWATISSYTENKGTTSKNGDASTVTFTQAHGLGSTPSFFTVIPTSTDADSEFFLTADATNITINYPFPPPTGTANLTYVWRAAL
jgi:hypothetical protein